MCLKMYCNWYNKLVYLKSAKTCVELLQVYFRDTSNILHLKTVNLLRYFSKYVNRFELDLVWNKCILNMLLFLLGLSVFDLGQLATT